MVGELLGKRQRRAHQTRNALSQRVVEPLDVIGFPRQLTDGSMLTLVCHVKKVMHRGWAYFHARLAFTMAAFNVLVQWHGLQPTASGFVPLSIAEFSL